MTPIKREKGTKDRALPDGQDEHNRQKPMAQSSVEHAVGCMGQPMGGLLFRRGWNDNGKTQNCVGNLLVYYVPTGKKPGNTDFLLLYNGQNIR